MGQITIESDLIFLIPNPHNEMKWGEVGGGESYLMHSGIFK